MPEQDNEGFTQIALGAPGAERAFKTLPEQKHGLVAIFYMHPKQNAAQSLEKGRPIYDETEYIRILVPGDKSSIVERPVRLGVHPKSDNVKFANEYTLFKQKKDQQVSGTPLEQWPVISRSQVLELQFFNVRTVEQLAEISDTHIQKFTGMGKLRDVARRFIQHAEAAAPLSQMQAALDESANALETQNGQIKALMTELASIKASLSQTTVPVEQVAETVAVATAAIAASQAPDPTKTPAPIQEESSVDDLYTEPPMELETATEEVSEITQLPKQKAPKKPKRRTIAT